MDPVPNVVGLDCPLCKAPLPAAVAAGGAADILLCPGCAHPLTCGNGQVAPAQAAGAADTSLPWLTPPSIPPVSAPAPQDSKPGSLRMIDLFGEPTEPEPLELVDLVQGPAAGAPPSRASASSGPASSLEVGYLQPRWPLALGWAAAVILALVGADLAVAGPEPLPPLVGTGDWRPQVIVEDILVTRRGPGAEQPEPEVAPEPRTAVLVPSKAPGRSPPRR